MIGRLIIGALMIGAVYSVVGIGYSVIYSASGLMSLCQGDMLMFGAFLGLFFYGTLGLPFPIALLITAVIMFLLGMGIQKFLVIPLLKKASGFASVISCKTERCWAGAPGCSSSPQFLTSAPSISLASG